MKKDILERATYPSGSWALHTNRTTLLATVIVVAPTRETEPGEELVPGALDA